MSDGYVFLNSVFALALLWSLTRVAVAVIARRAASLAQAPEELAAIRERLARLEELMLQNADHLARLEEAQRFSQALHTNAKPPNVSFQLTGE